MNRYTKKHDIIRFLSIEKNGLRFTDLREKVGISKPVLSRYLKELQNKKEITSMWKGRERTYLLAKNFTKNPQMQISHFSGVYINNALWNLDFTEHKSFDDFCNDVSNKITAMLFFCILKSIQTGQSWLSAVNIREFSRGVLDIMIHDMSAPQYDEMELEWYITHMNMDDFTEINKQTRIKYAKNVSIVYQKLKTKYVKEMKQLEKASQIK